MKHIFKEYDCDRLCLRKIIGTVGFISCILGYFLKLDEDITIVLIWFSLGLLGITGLDKLVKVKEELL